MRLPFSFLLTCIIIVAFKLNAFDSRLYDPFYVRGICQIGLDYCDLLDADKIILHYEKYLHNEIYSQINAARKNKNKLKVNHYRLVTIQYFLGNIRSPLPRRQNNCLDYTKPVTDTIEMSDESVQFNFVELSTDKIVPIKSKWNWITNKSKKYEIEINSKKILVWLKKPIYEHLESLAKDDKLLINQRAFEYPDIYINFLTDPDDLVKKSTIN